VSTDVEILLVLLYAGSERPKCAVANTIKLCDIPITSKRNYIKRGIGRRGNCISGEKNVHIHKVVSKHRNSICHKVKVRKRRIAIVIANHLLGKKILNANYQRYYI
jgi:hypothetical protein